MTNRRDMLKLGLALPFLKACGGGQDDARDDRVVGTPIVADDWPTASPESEAIPASAMQRLLSDGASLPAMRAILVVRNGKLIGEQYYGGAKSSDLLHIRSATKTVSSLLIGQAIRDGKISDTSVLLQSLLPRELSLVPGAAAGAIPLRRILQMRGGLQWDESALMQEIFLSPDLTQMTLRHPATGGTSWNYDSGSSHLLSPILANAYGMSDALAVATRNLFEPLGIRQVAWSRDASGVNHGSFGLQLRPRDLAKIAWMSADGGQWGGRSVVPANWLAESHASHVDLGLGPDLTRGGYGYLWWTGTLGGQAVKLAWGFGGQLAILVPGLRMAVTTAAQWNIPLPDGARNEDAILALVSRFIGAAQGA
jgi:CubicO group peptidase (beta-lactamase class C family)